MGSGEVICSVTESARYSGRKTQCNQMRKWECESAVEQYRELCLTGSTSD